MSKEQDNIDERQARIEAMIGQFREAQQLRLVRRGIVLWKRAQAAERAMVYRPPGPPAKIH